MTAYAVLADLYQYGLPLVAMGSVSTTVQQKLLDGRNSYADSKMRARYKLPLLTPYPIDLVQNICKLTAWDIMVIRTAAPDVTIQMHGEMAMKWFDDVERQRCHPDVVESGSESPGYAAPLIISKPVQGW